MTKRGFAKSNDYWMTTREVAEELGWSMRKVQRYAQKWWIPGMQFRMNFRENYRFKREAILKLKTRLETSEEPEKPEDYGK